ncbi:MAG: hypothetical protein ACYDH0_04675 [Candidatus Aminicenantales bacterium]
MKLEWEFDPPSVVRSLFLVVVLLTIASLAGVFSTYILGDGHLRGFVPEFNLDREMNVPTWFSSALLLFIAGLLRNLAAVSKPENVRFIRFWKGLAAGFLFLSIDEIAAIHEMAVDPLKRLFHAGGVFHFSWVILGIAIAAFLAVVCLKPLRALPPRVRVIFLAAAFIFLSGALGLEMIGGLYVEGNGPANIVYALFANGEEFLEMCGQVVFIKGLFLVAEGYREKIGHHADSAYLPG